MLKVHPCFIVAQGALLRLNISLCLSFTCMWYCDYCRCMHVQCVKSYVLISSFLHHSILPSWSLCQLAETDEMVCVEWAASHHPRLNRRNVYSGLFMLQRFSKQGAWLGGRGLHFCKQGDNTLNLLIYTKNLTSFALIVISTWSLWNLAFGIYSSLCCFISVPGYDL